MGQEVINRICKKTPRLRKDNKKGIRFYVSEEVTEGKGDGGGGGGGGGGRKNSVKLQRLRTQSEVSRESRLTIDFAGVWKETKKTKSKQKKKKKKKEMYILYIQKTYKVLTANGAARVEEKMRIQKKPQVGSCGIAKNRTTTFEGSHKSTSATYQPSRHMQAQTYIHTVDKSTSVRFDGLQVAATERRVKQFLKIAKKESKRERRKTFQLISSAINGPDN
ncbi:hypothetical protein RUM44_000119 [Polyplax serrata]|uniref:Uncharacterized protein n=1 Tax=Polyplax serrata TaxID=468196 RepID=A0ABR1B505_POLSC